MKKYKSIRFPVEAFDGLKIKNQVMNNIAREEGIKKRINYTDTLRYLTKKEIIIYNDEIRNFCKNKNLRRKVRVI